MSNPTRDRILARLSRGPVPDLPHWQAPTYAPDQRQAKFTAAIEAVHADVHAVSRADWPQRLATILGNRGVNSLLYGPGSALAEQLTAHDAPYRPLPYDQSIEGFKDQFVTGIDAAITTSLGAIAETGTIVLWPTAHEPRLMSVLPPIHVALVEADTIADNLDDLVRAQNWAAGMPTNLVLVSGPSKTADIEQTLAYGVHGPKELIVLVIED